jgi:hypothetical protein
MTRGARTDPQPPPSESWLDRPSAIPPLDGYCWKGLLADHKYLCRKFGKFTQRKCLPSVERPKARYFCLFPRVRPAAQYHDLNVLQCRSIANRVQNGHAVVARQMQIEENDTGLCLSHASPVLMDESERLLTITQNSQFVVLSLLIQGELRYLRSRGFVRVA